MKKFVWLILALCLTLICTMAAAEEESAVYESGDYRYILLPDGTAEIINYLGLDAEGLTIPSALDGYTVTVIGDKVFYQCSSLTSITIPDSVMHLGSNPFACCDKLEEINVSINHPTLDTINGVLFDKTEKKLICYPCAFTEKNYTIPQGIRVIGDEAFAGCKSLTSITIPDSVTFIGDSAFMGCFYLTRITIPDSVTSIGDSAFAGCRTLTRITIPDSVTSIGNAVFSHCAALTSITIPDSVTSIGNAAFSCCYDLTSITIPDNVTAIGDYAFSDCRSLTSATIPDSVTSIGEQAFSGCPDSLVLTVGQDSYAKQYAIDNNMKYTLKRTYEDAPDWLND